MVKKILKALMVASAVVAAALALAAGAAGAYTANRAAAADAALYRLGVLGLGAMSGAVAEYSQAPSHVRDLVAETGPGSATTHIHALDLARKATQERLAELGPIIRGDAEKERMLGEIEEGVSLYWAEVEVVKSLAAAGRRPEALAWMGGAAFPRFQAAKRLMFEMRAAMEADAADMARANRASASKAGLTALACMLAVALLCVLSATSGLAALKKS
jgi:hypothetical protein